MNRLAHEQSPYLQQHAQNPVDWFPWGAEAFDKAAAENKPIFLSVGYSTCHWCHVMERESFENPQIAAALNRSFVSIKVDREERPDVDRIYMTFIQATSGSGGWPMSVFLTPDRRPFYGGTYFPPDTRYGRPGFLAVLESLARSWAQDRERIEESGSNVVAQLRQYTEPRHAAGGAQLEPVILDSAFSSFRRSYDARLGGFGAAPKFPRPSTFLFLLRYGAGGKNGEAVEMVTHTLRAMAAGGMHDQLGGGFHRYSVDAQWFVPHFEKMLYDQAQLATAYLEAYQITRDTFFAGVARDIFEYVLRDLTHPDGGFYSAEDADSAVDFHAGAAKSEGAFYIWSWPEIVKLLDPPTAELFAFTYGVEREGNVAEDPHGEFTQRNILAQRHTNAEAARRFNLSETEVAERLTKARQALLQARSSRPRPHLDDKILAAWNGLMISAFALGGRVLHDPRYTEAASRAAHFVLTRMQDAKEGFLLRRFRDGDAAIPALLDDYAFLIQGLIDLYQTDSSANWLKLAVTHTEAMLTRFADPNEGAFFSTEAGRSDLILRIKDDYDGAEPSGNSIAILDLLRLARLLGKSDWAAQAERALVTLLPRLSSEPTAVPQLLVALDLFLAAPSEAVLVGLRTSVVDEYLAQMQSHFLPYTPIILLDSEENRSFFANVNPALAQMLQVGGLPTLYVCRNFACQAPTTDLSSWKELLQ